MHLMTIKWFSMSVCIIFVFSQHYSRFSQVPLKRIFADRAGII